jgi:hypothetical protein
MTKKKAKKEDRRCNIDIFIPGYKGVTGCREG